MMCRGSCSRGSSVQRLFFIGRPGLSAIEGLDLALLVEAEHDGVGGQIDDRVELLGKFGSLESLNERTR